MCLVVLFNNIMVDLGNVRQKNHLRNENEGLHTNC